MTSVEIRFLCIETVLHLHEIAIIDQGGDPSIRDRGLLESALALPRQLFAGQYLHPTIPAMAAAYAFHIAQNHPFFDGNKRAALSSMLAFLVQNGWKLNAPDVELEQVILELAAGKLTKQQLTDWISKYVRDDSGMPYKPEIPYDL